MVLIFQRQIRRVALVQDDATQKLDSSVVGRLKKYLKLFTRTYHIKDHGKDEF